MKHTLVRFFANQWGLIALIFAGIIYVFSLATHHPPNFSPYDEWVLFDYLVKVPVSGMVHIGEQIGNEALFRMSCFGDAFGPAGEICRGPNWTYTEYSSYPLQGITSAAGYTPVYFWITYPTAKFFEMLFQLEFITAARATGIIWLSFGFIFLSKIFKLFKINQVLLLGIGLGFLTLPVSNSAFTYISADSTVFTFGTLLIYLVLRFLLNKDNGVFIIPVAFLGYVIKGTLLFTELFCALLIIAVTIFSAKFPNKFQKTRKIWLNVTYTGFLIISGYLFDKVWGLIITLGAVGNSPEQGMDTPLALRSIITGALSFIPDFPDRNSMLVTDYVYIPISLLLVAGIFAWFFTQTEISTISILSGVTLISCVLLVPTIVVFYSVMHGYVVPVPPRYGIGLISLTLLSITIIAKNIWSKGIILLVGVGTFSVMITNVYIPLN